MLSIVIVSSSAFVNGSHWQPNITEVYLQLQIAMHRVPEERAMRHACRAENGVTCDWSPDGRHLLTATIAPRLRVDNGLQIYRCTLVPFCTDARITPSLLRRWVHCVVSPAEAGPHGRCG